MQLSREEIVKELKKIFVDADEKNAELVEKCDESWDLSTDFGLTSIGILYIIISVEETFKIRFEGVNMKDFKTLGDVVNYIEGKLS